MWVFGFRSRYEVRGQSMDPLLEEEDQVFTKSIYGHRQIAVGEVVVATHPFIPSKIIIKQVKESAGDSVFVEGVNTKCSTDSRSFGWIPNDRVLGVVTAIV